MNLNALLNTPKRIELRGTAVSGKPLIYTIISEPKYGILTTISNGIYNYLPIENKVDSFQYIVTEGTMNSLIGTVVINNFSENDVNSISKIQGNYTFSNITFDGTTWTFGTIRTENFYQYLDYNILGNLRFYNIT